VLILAILFAQLLGLTHSIVHAAWENKQSTQLTHMTSVIERAIEGGGKAHHSCAAFDDATLAATIYSAPLTLPPLPGTHVLALWQAFTSRDASCATPLLTGRLTGFARPEAKHSSCLSNVLWLSSTVLSALTVLSSAASAALTQPEEARFSALAAESGLPDTVPRIKSTSIAAFLVEERSFGPALAAA
jgi:hypothetical protein